MPSKAVVMHADTTNTMDDAGRASLGPTILGGLIGAAVGIAVHVAIETGGGMRWQPREAAWFAIVIGLLTGLGVRQMNKHHMERSYLRGAVSAIIALAAIVLSTVLISKVMEHYDALSKNKQVAAKAPETNDAAKEDNAAEAPKTEPAAEPAATAPAGPMAGGVGRIRQDKLNPWQFVFMAVGALAAYELGRGVEHSRRAEVAGEPMPVATDPSN
jgi:hypothetical protein